ncbi:DUF2768 domain-containing protein [Neobacillus piezotolerans]|uniref:DUF2768 domain-containing protein n=1 Tax=Neobacillus piezotolerans TaxID=2259171 RepID=A0A3D8GQ88_9BACI|nr:DUF2768 domain-containing protein [Neobacillus piezotolerans]RDU36339.1 DUF2768 domain-containing protein [Neobacillus piezotolerans]
MSPALMKMWVSLAAMGFMFVSIISIYLSRYKLKGVFRVITALFAYALMIVSGIIIFLVVMSGPTGE